jgi:hypothetical protein
MCCLLAFAWGFCCLHLIMESELSNMVCVPRQRKVGRLHAQVRQGKGFIHEYCVH